MFTATMVTPGGLVLTDNRKKKEDIDIIFGNHYNIKSARLLGGTLHFSTMIGGHGVVDEGQAPAGRRPASPFPNEAG